ncbi:unnamed protein product [Rhodiola kirilowii]
MAQKTEKEEAEIKAVPEALTPCINSNASTISLNCFAAETSTTSSSISEPLSSGNDQERTDLEMMRESVAQRSKRPETHPAVAVSTNRCSGCRKKVGLTGFRCRCGDLFCSAHRYSDRHACSFDYKAAGKAAIARENPVVKASKIVRI